MKPAAHPRPRSRRLVRAGLCACIALALALPSLSAPRLVDAQPAQVDPRAIALFKEARALMERGAYAEACPKLEESLRIDPGMGTLYNLSDCYEKIGRTASAWTGFRDVAAAADAAGQGARAQIARERAATIEPKLSRVRVTVSPEAAAAGAEVQRNGITLGRLLWGADVPVDPGMYVISASAQGMSPWSATISAGEHGKIVTHTVPPLSPLKVAGPAAPTASVAGGHPPPPALKPEGKSAGAIVVFSAFTVLDIGAAVALLILSNSKQDEALRLRAEIPTDGKGLDNACLATPKPPACYDLEHAAKLSGTMKGLSIGGFVLGGLGLAGTLFYVLSPSSPPRPPGRARSFTIVPAVSASSGGLVAVGTF